MFFAEVSTKLKKKTNPQTVISQNKSENKRYFAKQWLWFMDIMNTKQLLFDEVKNLRDIAKKQAKKRRSSILEELPQDEEEEFKTNQLSLDPSEKIYV
jgi:hypothetical protein